MKISRINQKMKTKMMLPLNTETSSSLKMELSTKVSGDDNKDMVLESKFGLMAQDTKDSGNVTKLMAKESFGM